MTQLDVEAAYNTKAELLVFGSSRARRHYDTHILHDSLNMSVFNCGYNSMGIRFFYPRLCQILERHTPKMIIYDITPLYDFQQLDDKKVTLNKLKPFFHHKDTYRMMLATDKIEWLKSHSATYRYHGELSKYIADNDNKELFIDGYAPLNGINDVTAKKHTTSAVDNEKLRLLQNFIETCKSHNIRLVFVISPYYLNDMQDASASLKALANKYSIPVLDHFYDSNFVNDSTLYWDPSHLNSTGAKKFTEMIASELLSGCKPAR